MKTSIKLAMLALLMLVSGKASAGKVTFFSWMGM